MNTAQVVTLGLALMFGATQAQAEEAIDDFMYTLAPVAGYFNCSYKTNEASEKCLVTLTNVKSSIDARARRVFGANEELELMTIRWPDGDASRYLDIGGPDVYKLINLADNSSYNYKTDDDDGISLNFDEGLIIEDIRRREHIRLWE